MTTVSPQELPIQADEEIFRADIRRRIRNYIIDNLLLGTVEDLDDSASLTKSGIIDSTGTLELVTFLGEEFAISVTDKDLLPANLDSVDGMVALVERKSART